MRRMFELLKGARRGQRFARLNAPIKSDLQWWNLFMAQWNGVAMMANSGQVASGPPMHLGPLDVGPGRETSGFSYHGHRRMVTRLMLRKNSSP